MAIAISTLVDQNIAVTKLVARPSGIDVWFLIEAAISGYHIKEIFMGTKEHTSFEDYREGVSKLSKMAESMESSSLPLRHQQ